MRDYKKDIIQIDDGMIGIPITAENLHDSKAIWDALKAAPTPKKVSNGGWIHERHHHLSSYRWSTLSQR